MCIYYVHVRDSAQEPTHAPSIAGMASGRLPGVKEIWRRRSFACTELYGTMRRDIAGYLLMKKIRREIYMCGID